MDSRKTVFQQTGVVALGVGLGTAAMLGVFALLDQFAFSVVLGGIVGAVVAIGNFFFMAISVCMAADKAQNQDVQGGQATVKRSYLLRMVVMVVILFAFAKSGLCNVIALVVPLLFVRPTITIAEFFRKAGDSTQ